MPCCIQQGYQSAEKVQLLAHLAAAGIPLPEGAQIWGPGEGMSWRLVDRRGNPPACGRVGSKATVRSLAAAGGVRIVERDGWRHVLPNVG